VAAKEGLFAIGRLYNVHPRTIAAYNKLDMSKGLSIGSVLRIPLTDTNFSQSADKGKPVYYVTGENESLQKVSNVNNKVPLQYLRDWNKLSNNNVTKGKKLIVGFLIAGGNQTVALPVAAKDDTRKQTEEKAAIKTDSLKAIVKKNEETNKAVTKNEPGIVAKKDEINKTNPGVSKPDVSLNMSGQGYFKSSFDQQVKMIPLSKTETVTSGIFKVTSSVQDTKYYLLADDVMPGTIIRIINPDNNKAVYAKVLGAMEGIRQNQGFDIRVCNAAAASLGITETDKFIVKINY
jgi:hypothetical protein